MKNREPAAGAGVGRLPLAALMGLVLLAAPGWKLGPDMSLERGRHTATPLLDGRVLVVGGFTSQAFEPTYYWKETELYDPSLNLWYVAAPLDEPRAYHGAVRLLDGRVLVVGGYTQVDADFPALSSAEIYSPTFDVWTNAASMSAVKGTPRVALLPDGRVLAIGGASAEVYDPSADSWSPTGGPLQGRTELAAASLADGRVLITGGSPSEPPGGPALASAEVYDPSTGTFTAVGSMSTARIQHVAVLLEDGRVLVAGGSDGVSALDSAEIFDPAAGAFEPAPPMIVPRLRPTAMLLPGGDVLVTGGITGVWPDQWILRSTERFDPATGEWKPWFPLVKMRILHTLSPLPGGQVLAAGGYWSVLLGGDGFGYHKNTELSGDLSGPGPALDGEPCATAIECMSAVCSEGVCCATGCPQDGCHSCTGAAGPVGQCVALDAIPCAGDGNLCNRYMCQTGTCAWVGPGCDPPADPVCYAGWGCNPQTGCNYNPYPDGTPCSTMGQEGVCEQGICQPGGGGSGGTGAGGGGSGGTGAGGDTGGGGSGGTGGGLSGSGGSPSTGGQGGQTASSGGSSPAGSGGDGGDEAVTGCSACDVGASPHGGSSQDFRWLALIAGMATLATRRRRAPR